MNSKWTVRLVVVSTFLVAFLCATSAVAEKAIPQDMSWWGKGATPAPVKDNKDREGSWWWPKEPEQNKANDDMVWGNRRIVYSIMKAAPAPPPPAKAPAPPLPPPPPPAKAPAPPAPERIVLSDIYFDFDKTTIKPEGLTIVKDVADKLKASPNAKVTIEGHTDSIGTEEYNMRLGQRRADAAKNALVKEGIDVARTKTQSFGESKPVESNSTKEGRAKNRRVVFEIQR